MTKQTSNLRKGNEIYPLHILSGHNAIFGNEVLYNPGSLFDAILIFGMTFGIYKKSRICAILIFIDFILN